MYQSRRVVRNPELVANWKNLKHTNKKYRLTEPCICKKREILSHTVSTTYDYVYTKEVCKECGTLYNVTYKHDIVGRLPEFVRMEKVNVGSSR